MVWFVYEGVDDVLGFIYFYYEVDWFVMFVFVWKLVGVKGEEFVVGGEY